MMIREEALNRIVAAIGKFCPVPVPQDGLAQIERTLETFEDGVRNAGYREAMADVWAGEGQDDDQGA